MIQLNDLQTEIAEVLDDELKSVYGGDSATNLTIGDNLLKRPYGEYFPSHDAPIHFPGHCPSHDAPIVPIRFPGLPVDFPGHSDPYLPLQTSAPIIF